MQRIIAFLKSNTFLYLVIGLFAAQALFFSAAINYKVPSDEEYHYSFINYYAQKPITSGPIIDNQKELFNIGDIQRTPSYLYHYVMSFYLRIVQIFTSNIDTQVFMIRVVNVLFGILALLLFVRLSRKIRISALLTNLTVAWLILTGMFVWVFAGINYDNASIVLFILLLLQLASLKENIAIRKLLLSIITSIALVLTKETYLPVVVMSFLLLIIYLIGTQGVRSFKNAIYSSIKSEWKKSPVVLVLLVVLAIFFSGLFIERYGMNYVRYKKLTPICDQVHTIEQCKQHGIYRRNTGQKREFEERKMQAPVMLDSFPVYSAKWVGYIYQRTYFYRGMQTIPSNQKASRLAVATAVFAGLLLFFGALNLRKLNTLQLGIAIITLFYILMVLFYNFNTYRFYGYPFAIQGRYLLPILPFIYLATLGSAKLMYGKIGKHTRVAFLVIILILVGNNVVVHNPLIIYFNGRTILDQPVVGFIRNHIS